MAVGIIKKKKKITSKIYTINIGTNEYYGWYWNNLDGVDITDANIIDIIVWDVTNSNPTLVQKGMSGNFLRVYTKGSNTTVKVKIIYYS